MRVFRLALAACILCVLADTAPVSAQDADRPDFIGTWILDLDASSFGPSPAPDSPSKSPSSSCSARWRSCGSWPQKTML